MAARKTSPTIRRTAQRGQSLIEFAFLVPLVFGMVSTLREIEMAINASIVNQRYARNTMMYLFFNHRWYPEDQFVQMNGNKVMQRWWVGVGATPVSTTDATTPPTAPTIKVGGGLWGLTKGAGANPAASDDGTSQLPPGTPRQYIRIRAMTFVCLPPRGSTSPEYSLNTMGETAFALGAAGGNYCQNSN